MGLPPPPGPAGEEPPGPPERPPDSYPPPPPPGRPPAQEPPGYPPPPPPGPPPPPAGPPPAIYPPPPPPPPGQPPVGHPPPQPPSGQPPGYSSPPAWPPVLPGATPALRLRPLSFGELLDEAFRTYRRHFWLLVSISLLLEVPTLILQIFSGQADQLGTSAAVLNQAIAGSQPQSTAPPGLNLVALGLQPVVLILLIPFIEGAITLAAIDVALGRPATFSSCLRGVLRRYWALLGVALLTLLLVPLFLCFPLALWIAIRWSVSVPALLAEGVGPVVAIRRSWRLTHGSWWRIFGILAVVVIIQLVLNTILGALALPLAALVPFVPPLVRGTLGLTVSTLGTAVITPVLYLCFVLIYFDLRIRKESFDLDQLAAQVRGGPA